MSPSRVIRDEKITFCEGRFCVYIKILEVSKSEKFPDGLKLKCVLMDMELNKTLLLLDNHEPYGYHFHPLLPKEKNFRLTISINSYEEAILIFLKEVEKAIQNEIQK